MLSSDLGSLVFVGNIALIVGILLVVLILHVVVISGIEAVWIARVGNEMIHRLAVLNHVGAS